MNLNFFYQKMSIMLVIFMIQVNTHCVQFSMHDATSTSSDSPIPAPSVEHLQQEVQQLKDKLTWYETEYLKLTKMIASSKYRR